MGTIKDRNSKDLTEAEDIKKKWGIQSQPSKVMMELVCTFLDYLCTHTDTGIQIIFSIKVIMLHFYF